jgi:hypothetical protein
MITLACFVVVAVGLILGMFFNVYALLALSMLVALLNFPSAFNVGIGHAATSVGVSVVLLQIGYFAGLLVRGSLIPQSRRRSLRSQQDEFHVRGRDNGLNADLLVSIARQTLDRARNRDEEGEAQNDLGISLQTLGERESGTARLGIQEKRSG